MDGGVGCPPVGLGMTGEGSKIVSGQELAQLTSTAGEHCCYSVRVGQLSLCSQVFTRSKWGLGVGVHEVQGVWHAQGA